MTPPTQTIHEAAAAFRKKPVTIQAVQLTKEVAAAYLLEKKPLPAGVEFSSASHKDGKVNNFYSYINTLEGRMDVSLGDWIITGVKGEHYPCKPDIFELTYERAELTRPLEVAEADVDAAIAASGMQLPIPSSRRHFRLALESYAASRVTAPAAVTSQDQMFAALAIQEDELQDLFKMHAPGMAGNLVTRVERLLEECAGAAPAVQPEPGSSDLAVAETKGVQVPLTDKQLKEIWVHAEPGTTLEETRNNFARAIEAAHGIAHTTAKDGQ